MSEAMLSLLSAVLIAALPIVVKELKEFLRSKGEGFKEQNKAEYLNGHVDRAIQTISDVVDAISQKTVDALKNRGEFTKEKQKEVFEAAKNDVLAILTRETKEALKEAFEDVNKWLDNKIESTVRHKKKNREKDGAEEEKKEDEESTGD